MIWISHSSESIVISSDPRGSRRIRAEAIPVHNGPGRSTQCSQCHWPRRRRRPRGRGPGRSASPAPARAQIAWPGLACRTGPPAALCSFVNGQRAGAAARGGAVLPATVFLEAPPREVAQCVLCVHCVAVCTYYVALCDRSLLPPSLSLRPTSVSCRSTPAPRAGWSAAGQGPWPCQGYQLNLLSAACVVDFPNNKNSTRRDQ